MTINPGVQFVARQQPKRHDQRVRRVVASASPGPDADRLTPAQQQEVQQYIRWIRHRDSARL